MQVSVVCVRVSLFDWCVLYLIYIRHTENPLVSGPVDQNIRIELVLIYPLVVCGGVVDEFSVFGKS